MNTRLFIPELELLGGDIDAGLIRLSLRLEN
jgi:hypothetical protein